MAPGTHAPIKKYNYERWVSVLLALCVSCTNACVGSVSFCMMAFVLCGGSAPSPHTRRRRRPCGDILIFLSLFGEGYKKKQNNETNVMPPHHKKCCKFLHLSSFHRRPHRRTFCISPNKSKKLPPPPPRSHPSARAVCVGGPCSFVLFCANNALTGWM